MTTLKFWNTGIGTDTDVTKLDGETLLNCLEYLITTDSWDQCGTDYEKSELGQFRIRVYNELIHRLSYYPTKDYPL